jgi:hypothetical protein
MYQDYIVTLYKYKFKKQIKEFLFLYKENSYFYNDIKLY